MNNMLATLCSKPAATNPAIGNRIVAILSIVLVVYGLFCIALVIFKIPAIWNMSKIQAFVKLMGEKGTKVFIGVWGVAAGVAGIIIWIKLV